MSWLHTAIMITAYSVGLVALGIEGLLVARRRSAALRAFLAFHVVYTIKIVLSGLVVVEAGGISSLVLPPWYPVLDWVVFVGMGGALVPFLVRLRAVRREDRESPARDARARRLTLPAVLLLLPNVLLWFSPWLFRPEIDQLLFFAFPLTYLGVTVVAVGSALREPPTTGASVRLSEFAATNKLSEREAEVVSRLIDGKGNAAIAEELFVSVHTVKRHIYNIFKKTGASSRLHLIRKIEQ
ncbi:MAG: helix-turn-helix transcriptional regulator [Spirochaetota bacterium]